MLKPGDIRAVRRAARGAAKPVEPQRGLLPEAVTVRPTAIPQAFDGAPLIIDLCLPLRPVTKERARAGGTRRDGKAARPHSTLRTKSYEEFVGAHLFAEMRRRKARPINGPVRVCLAFFYRTSLPIWQKGSSADVDNLAKAIKDALNNVVYGDDVQVVSLLTEKFAADGNCVEIHIETTPSPWSPEHSARRRR